MMDDLSLRMASSFLAGAILSQTGSLLQTSTRNLLASPSTLGFDGLSILWILLFHSLLIFLNIEQPLWALTLSGLPLVIASGYFFVGFSRGSDNIEKIVLIGLTFNLLVGAVFSLWQFLFVAFNLPFPVELWFGHFRFADETSVLILLAFELLLLLGWQHCKKDLILLTLGSQVIANSGLSLRKTRTLIYISIAAGTFLVISLFGAFSFLALIFPIIARRLWFRAFDLRGELLVGSLCNGFFLMSVDFLCYQFPILGAEIPVGLIATALGAVSLIGILWKSHMAKGLK